MCYMDQENKKSELILKNIISYIKEPNIIGCSEKEILEIEFFFNVKLPVLYKKFLSKMGHNAGDFLSGTDAFYNNIFSIREWAKELLIECNEPFELKDNYFIFAIHQGYQFWFFDIEDDKYDPPIYYYFEGDKSYFKKYDRFSEFLLESFNYIKK